MVAEIAALSTVPPTQFVAACDAEQALQAARQLHIDAQHELDEVEALARLDE